MSYITRISDHRRYLESTDPRMYVENLYEEPGVGGPTKRFSTSGFKVKVEDANWFGKILNRMNKLRMPPSEISKHHDFHAFLRHMKRLEAEENRVREAREEAHYTHQMEYSAAA